MALREVVQVGNDVLRKTSKPVTVFDSRLEDLIDDMWETMYANNGMGLAAPQVGILKRIVVMDVNEMKLELINPEIIESSGSDIEQEGCLSCGKIKGITLLFQVKNIWQDVYVMKLTTLMVFCLLIK